MADDFEKIFPLGGASSAAGKASGQIKASGVKPAGAFSAKKTDAFVHPSEGSGIRTEIVEVEGGYAGEGCEEHYNMRFVSEEPSYDDDEELTFLQSAIVWGELLNNPKYKE